MLDARVHFLISVNAATKESFAGVAGIDAFSTVKENIQIYLGSFVTQNIDIRVVNVLGSEVFKTSIKTSKIQESLPLSQLERGVYFMYLNVGNKLKTHKFIKK